MNVTREEFPIKITDIAVEQALNVRKNPAEHLRIALQGGGCSGLQYKLDFDDKTYEEDWVMETDGLTVIIDGHSANLLAGATVDYVTTIMASGFKFINPEAKRQCGCGSSFSY
jgi:iron-sulfur cluster assembly protein